MRQIFLLLLLCNLGSHSLCAQIGINTITPDSSAALDITSTFKGFLPPRMSAVQRDSIRRPATGLIVFSTSDSSLQFNSGTPLSPVWRRLIVDSSGPTSAISFRAELTGAVANGIPLTDGTYQNCFYDAVGWNDGNGYNPTTGIFTAPVKGTYTFEAHATFNSISAYGAGVYLYLNNAAYTSSFINCPSTNFGSAISTSTTLRVNSGDQVRVLIYSRTTGAQVYYLPIAGPGTARAHFSGSIIQRL